MEIKKTKIIGVEGSDEVNFFKALFKHIGIQEIQLIDFGGKNNFNNKISQIVKLDNFNNVTHFGLIRDADDNYKGAVESLKSSLKKAKLPIPDKDKPFSSDGKLKIGIFVMPGVNKTGMLESLCIETINSSEYECIENFLNCNNNELPQKEKSIIQIYLSIKDPIVKSLGHGALKGHINFDNNKLNYLIDFIKEFNKQF